MTSEPQSELPEDWVSDRVDLDELFKDAMPVGDGSSLAIPGFFESDEELEEFQGWLRAERKRSV